MEAKEYQNLAMRTNDGKGTDRLFIPDRNGGATS